MGRATPPEDHERLALAGVLRRIEKAGLELASESDVDVRVEKDRGGRFPYVTFRAYGLVHKDDSMIDWES